MDIHEILHVRMVFEKEAVSLSTEKKQLTLNIVNKGYR